jgi:hypothetical protein
MPKYERIIIKISLTVLFTVFLSSNSMASTQNITINQNDSIYKYNALENKVNFLNKTDNLKEKLPEKIILIDNNIKKLEDTIKQQISSIQKSEESMDAIKKISTLQTFIIGKRLGILKFQMVQMKAQSHILKTLILDTIDSTIKDKINTQIEILEKEQEKVEIFIFEQESKFSLFGWLVASL